MTTIDLQIDISIEKDTILDCIRKWGGASSDAALEPSCKVFSSALCEGIICYRKEHGCIIVYGDPICASSDVKVLTEAFHLFFQNQCKNIIYISSSKSFVDFATPRLCKAFIEFGEELSIDPHNDPRGKSGKNASLLRRKVRRAEKMGTSVNEFDSLDSDVKAGIETVAKAWTQSRSGPQIHTSNVFLFEHEKGKRWFYAEMHGLIVGVAVLNELQSYHGWLLNHVMITKDASAGTSEMLIVKILETLKAEGCHYVTFGAVPATILGKIHGMKKFPSWVARQSFKIANKIFYLEGRKKFWQKYHPDSNPYYLLFQLPTLGIREIQALMAALNVRF